MLDPDAFKLLYQRLCRAYSRAPNAEQCVEWWKALEHGCTPDQIEQAIRKTIGLEKHFPSLATLRSHLSSTKFVATSDRVCDRCGGNTWVPGPPIQLDETHTYDTVIRCPVCWTLGAKSPAA